MSASVFLSYRRLDAQGHARHLHRQLGEWIAPEQIFFDHASIDAAEDFRDEIDRAVEACAVLLALVGPGWLSATDAQGRRRLDQPQDIVRREVALALERGKVVLLVLLEDAEVPPEHELPPPLRALAGRTALRLRGRVDEYAHAVQSLVQRLAEVDGVRLRKSVMLADASAAVAPDHLPLLCDRSDQARAVLGLLRDPPGSGARRPFVCVLHGPADERHEYFVERLESFELPLGLARSGLGRGVKFVDLCEPLPLESAQRFAGRVRERLADELGFAVDDDAALVDGLRRSGITVLLLTLSWRSSELAGRERLPLQHLADWAAGLPDLDAQRAIGVLLCLKYDAAPRRGLLGRLFGGGGGDRDALREALATLPPPAPARLHWRVLEELPRITLRHIEDWTRTARRSLGRAFDVRETEMQQVVAEGPQPMDKVYPELERWLDRARSRRA